MDLNSINNDLELLVETAASKDTVEDLDPREILRLAMDVYIYGPTNGEAKGKLQVKKAAPVSIGDSHVEKIHRKKAPSLEPKAAIREEKKPAADESNAGVTFHGDKDFNIVSLAMDIFKTAKTREIEKPEPPKAAREIEIPVPVAVMPKIKAETLPQEPENVMEILGDLLAFSEECEKSEKAKVKSNGAIPSLEEKELPQFPGEEELHEEMEDSVLDHIPLTAPDVSDQAAPVKEKEPEKEADFDSEDLDLDVPLTAPDVEDVPEEASKTPAKEEASFEEEDLESVPYTAPDVHEIAAFALKAASELKIDTTQQSKSRIKFAGDGLLTIDDTNDKGDKTEEPAAVNIAESPEKEPLPDLLTMDSVNGISTPVKPVTSKPALEKKTPPAEEKKAVSKQADSKLQEVVEPETQEKIEIIVPPMESIKPPEKESLKAPEPKVEKPSPVATPEKIPEAAPVEDSFNIDDWMDIMEGGGKAPSTPSSPSGTAVEEKPPQGDETGYSLKEAPDYKAHHAVSERVEAIPKHMAADTVEKKGLRKKGMFSEVKLSYKSRLKASKKLTAKICSACGKGEKANECISCGAPKASIMARLCESCASDKAIAGSCVVCNRPNAKIIAKLCDRCRAQANTCYRCGGKL